ncbi:probable RNA methyltransferase At5g51130 [Ananas comosus]|uniref:RNA methyltransferase n=1 Tax=Ananas comosus TaxID=4615 RepID=A0A6P5EL59_ANACO|nr:probable RNA methyltransferase At5g51130 [Ananas comosus]XP_020084189.1 probable RNA methyltransferase At5g51130 [Ananas comosus]
MATAADQEDDDTQKQKQKQKQKPTEAKITKRKESSIYGNYKHYYGYRIDPSTEEDPRLAVFKREWFEGRDCLDIGCNQGLIAISIAKKFLCRSILGIDIDAGLVETAQWNLRKIARLENAHKRAIEGSNLTASNSLSCLGRRTGQTSKGKIPGYKHDDSPGTAEDLFNVVSFCRQNFIESLDGCSEKYDTILCLSVTKWIHLNWGDDGLITLFVKIWRLLRPGGIFLLEPQPWTSYKKNRRVSEIAIVNYDNILLYPHIFREILLDKIGFRSVEVVTDNLSGTVAGFDRPILAFLK